MQVRANHNWKRRICDVEDLRRRSLLAILDEVKRKLESESNPVIGNQRATGPRGLQDAVDAAKFYDAQVIRRRIVKVPGRHKDESSTQSTTRFRWGDRVVVRDRSPARGNTGSAVGKASTAGWWRVRMDGTNTVENFHGSQLKVSDDNADDPARCCDMQGKSKQQPSEAEAKNSLLDAIERNIELQSGISYHELLENLHKQHPDLVHRISFDRFKTVAKRARNQMQKSFSKPIASDSIASMNPLFNPFKDTRRIIRPGDVADESAKSAAFDKSHKNKRSYREVLLQGKTKRLPAHNATHLPVITKASEKDNKSALAAWYELRKSSLQQQREKILRRQTQRMQSSAGDLAPEETVEKVEKVGGAADQVEVRRRASDATSATKPALAAPSPMLSDGKAQEAKFARWVEGQIEQKHGHGEGSNNKQNNAEKGKVGANGTGVGAGAWLARLQRKQERQQERLREAAASSDASQQVARLQRSPSQSQSRQRTVKVLGFRRQAKIQTSSSPNNDVQRTKAEELLDRLYGPSSFGAGSEKMSQSVGRKRKTQSPPSRVGIETSTGVSAGIFGGPLKRVRGSTDAQLLPTSNVDWTCTVVDNGVDGDGGSSVLRVYDVCRSRVPSVGRPQQEADPAAAVTTMPLYRTTGLPLYNSWMPRSGVKLPSEMVRKWQAGSVLSPVSSKQKTD